MSGSRARPPFSPADLVVDAEVRRRCVELGFGIHVDGEPGYPAALAEDLERPPILYSRGDVGVVGGPLAVGIVGTRNASVEGRELARWFGRELSAVGVQVVSGLAAGIDAAAHRGAMEAAGAPPVAVVGCGLDIVYPHTNQALFDDIARVGAVISEHEPGVPPMPHHFPLRNRIIAALSTVLVVVESRAAGGSLITAGQAADRGRTVLAVPGSVRSPTAEGTNRLLRDGCGPALDPDDVLIALGLAASEQQALPLPRATRADPDRTRPARMTPDRTRPDQTGRAERRVVRSGTAPDRPVGIGLGPDSWLLALVEGDATTVDELAMRSGVGLGAVLAALERLDDAGLVAQHGPWIRRTGRR